MLQKRSCRAAGGHKHIVESLGYFERALSRAGAAQGVLNNVKSQRAIAFELVLSKKLISRGLMRKARVR